MRYRRGEREALRKNQTWPSLWPPLSRRRDKEKSNYNHYLKVYFLVEITVLQLHKMLTTGEFKRSVHTNSLNTRGNLSGNLK